ncbi:MAG: DUF2029 domain-containing protein, partial [candidate division Zixibacteria bacterium]|nr:DUF2029 domain-containing protein [candidate division Zixibacteria bacterium]
MKVGFERCIAAYSITTTLAIPLAHAMATLLRKAFDADAITAVYDIVLAVALVMLVSAFLSRQWPRGLSAYLSSLVVSLATVIILALVDRSLLLPLLAVPLVCPVGVLLSNMIARRLPVWMDGSLHRFPVRTMLLVVLALLMVVQTARLSSWVSDPSQDWWISTKNPLFAQHMCMVAYIYAADLNRQGVDNVYDQSYYPGLNPDADIRTTINNLHPEDPYQYPPQFLVLPRLAIALTNDFDLIKTFWLALQALFFGFIAWTVARFIGGQVGLMAALLIPLLWISFPVLANLQYGQFHLMSVFLAVAGMMWFARRRYFLGGASLAFAMLSKAAPGILLIYLLAKRRWKEAGWTLGFCVAFSLLALMVVGTEPFVAFFTYQIPAIQNGSAFAFAEIWPEFRDLLIAGNQSPFAFVFKLGVLGLPGMSISLANTVHLVYTVLVFVVALLAARVNGNR